MSEYVEREPEDSLPLEEQMDFGNLEAQMTDEHIVMPPEFSNNRALETYNLLRAENPWLPDPNRVSARRDLELTFGVDSIATLNMTVYVALPEVLHDRTQA
jgi:hypothetical protein